MLVNEDIGGMAQLIAEHTFGRGTESRGILDCLRRWDSSVRLGASAPSGFGKNRGWFRGV